MTLPPPDDLDDELPEEPPLLACPMFRLHGNMPQARLHPSIGHPKRACDSQDTVTAWHPAPGTRPRLLVSQLHAHPNAVSLPSTLAWTARCVKVLRCGASRTPRALRPLRVRWALCESVIAVPGIAMSGSAVYGECNACACMLAACGKRHGNAVRAGRADADVPRIFALCGGRAVLHRRGCARAGLPGRHLHRAVRPARRGF